MCFAYTVACRAGSTSGAVQKVLTAAYQSASDVHTKVPDGQAWLHSLKNTHDSYPLFWANRYHQVFSGPQSDAALLCFGV